ncbi:hypothetical protein B0H10DRAFT_1773037 [Mycena sp. CBHHK59/15]|nr:hypothetical protein B0H10DRAFT_1773037 [Mycena sp. CBHHK59/15]
MPLPLSITSRLAPELYDLILDEFHASKSTLSACSSVCRAWLLMCRRHLFFSVNLSPDFVKFLRNSEHAFATITPHIRHVGLGGGWMREQKDEFNDIILFMITLENVHKIHMETWSWTYLASPATKALLGGQGNVFQTVRAVDLKFIHFPSFNVLRTLASQFPRLQELAFDNVTWDTSDSDPGPEAPPSFLSGLHKLKISACSNRPIISWLSLKAAQPPPLRSLHLPEILPDESPLVGTFLTSLASTLEDLEFGFLVHNHDGMPALQDAIAKIDLSRHTRLRTIRIHQLALYQLPSPPASPGAPADVSPYAWLAPLLARVGARALAALAFDVWLGRESQLDVLDWRALVRVLASPSFASLAQVRFHVRGVEASMDDAVRGWIAHRLRDWDGADACLEASFE